jgi:hypothetical protein
MEYTYGDVPLDPNAVMLPFGLLHEVAVAVAVTDGGLTEVTVTNIFAVQFPASLTMTLYVPAATAVNEPEL